MNVLNILIDSFIHLFEFIDQKKDLILNIRLIVVKKGQNNQGKTIIKII